MNKRKYIRISELIGVKCKILSKSEDSDVNQKISIKGLTENISGGGILMVLTENLKVDTILELELELGKSIHPIQVIGNVVRSEKVDAGVYESGIEFTHYSLNDKKLLDEFLNNKME
ncbi:MAG: PilZ domain-containing protein [Leptospiraceae bacterium]|nr:PilZ domain-containing protein [Leptospiraceae bacterium]MCK6382361.1 PilZ domain-containing protein [Leptospiraceae bacterium]NUM40701.1 PilZ domain-containing protein [Leptospiraceae bacterium]